MKFTFGDIVVSVKIPVDLYIAYDNKKQAKEALDNIFKDYHKQWK